MIRDISLRRYGPVPQHAWILLLLLGTLTGISAERRPELVFTQSIGGILNPLGFLSESRVLYRMPLSRDTGILFNSTKLELGIVNEWSPADEMPGIAFNIEPIALFNIWVKAGLYEQYRLFGFGYRKLDGKNGPYHDSIVADITRENRTGSRITIAPSLKMKVGPVIVADNVTCNRIDLFNTEEYFYEIRTALPHYSHDFNFINDLIVLYEWSSRLRTGVNYNLVYVRGTEVRQQKLGAMVISTPLHRKLHSLFGLVTGGIYLESQIRHHGFYIAALGGFEIPLRIRRDGYRHSE
jgi:hypothetical protein